MTTERERLYGMTVGPTMAYMDCQKNVLILRGCPAEERAEVVRIMVEQRRVWRDWLTMTQRRWQKETRRPSRARHYDSIAIRESYVRITGRGALDYRIFL